jgi:hypothetical protein
MKAIANESRAKVSFPMLMESSVNDVIVLFTGEKNGTVVMSGRSGYGIGEYRSDWLIKAFTPFSGTITLEND